MAGTDFRVAQAVSKLAKQHGLSLRALAERVDLPYRTVQNYLTGEGKIPAEFIARCCKLFGVEADYLLFWGVDLDREILRSAIGKALEHVLPRLEYTPEGIKIKLEGVNDFPAGDARNHYVNAMLLHLEPAIRDAYVDARTLALRSEGKAGVYPTDEAVRVNAVHGPFEELP